MRTARRPLFAAAVSAVAQSLVCLFVLLLTELPNPDRVVAERSMLIKNMLEDVGDDSIRQDNPIPIPNVSALTTGLFGISQSI